MNLETVQVDRDDARRIYEEYRDAKKKNQRSEDAVIKRVYRRLAKGERIISIQKTIEAAGVDEKSLPRLAICRADARMCYFRRMWQTYIMAASAEGAWRSPARNSVSRVTPARIELPLLPGMLSRSDTRHGDGFRDDAQALVPSVPPRHRPEQDLSGYHILWEAEWKKTPPVDPALLKHLGGEFFVVLAVWDLTEVERLALMDSSGLVS